VGTVTGGEGGSEVSSARHISLSALLDVTALPGCIGNSKYTHHAILLCILDLSSIPSAEI